MQQIAVKVRPRTETGKGPNHRLRAAGQIPGVIYGQGTDVQKVSLDHREFDRAVSTSDAAKSIFNIQFDGSGASGDENAAVIREIQRDPLTRRILHVDMYKIRMDVENDFEVAVHGIGTPVGVREGGILETHLRSLEIRCLPMALPSHINIDVANLKVNQSFHVSDVTAPEGVTILTHGDQVLFTVLPPKAEVVAAAPAEGEEVAQPEVIGKKKEEGEGETPAADEKAKPKEKDKK